MTPVAAAVQSRAEQAARLRRVQRRRAKREVARKLVTIGSHSLIDKLVRPVPRTLDDVPWAPEAVTAEWLTRAVCRDVAGAAVTSVTFGPSTNGSSTRVFATLGYNEEGRAAGLPEAVFIKGSRTLKTRLLCGLPRLMSSEADFFDKVRPELEIECPQGYFGSHDPVRWRHCIVMEDIGTTKGADFLDVSTPLSREDIGEMVRLQATYHAHFWNSPRFETDLAWLTRRRATSFVQDLTNFVDLEAATHSGVIKYADLLPPRLVGDRDRLSPALWESLRCSDEGAQTLMHGDAHPGQYYRTRDGAVGIFDWQTCGVSSWSFDLSYTLSASLRIDDRRAWEVELVQTYVDRLAECGVQEPPTTNEAFERYQRGLMYPLFAWVFALNHPRLQPQMQPRDTCVELVKRIGAAVDDNDTVNLLLR